jgi:glutamine amidotransferase PdxT
MVGGAVAAFVKRPTRSQLLRQAEIVTTARAVLRREHADAGTCAQLVDLVKQIDNIEPRGERLVAWCELEVVRNAQIDQCLGCGMVFIGKAGAQAAAINQIGGEQRVIPAV